jgi:hypothetical protein
MTPDDNLIMTVVRVLEEYEKKGQKKRQVTYIAPLQPPTLATFLSWGSSVGAGRIRLARCKGKGVSLIFK